MPDAKTVTRTIQVSYSYQGASTGFQPADPPLTCRGIRCIPNADCTGGDPNSESYVAWEITDGHLVIRVKTCEMTDDSLITIRAFNLPKKVSKEMNLRVKTNYDQVFYDDPGSFNRRVPYNTKSHPYTLRPNAAKGPKKIAWNWCPNDGECEVPSNTRQRSHTEWHVEC